MLVLSCGLAATISVAAAIGIFEGSELRILDQLLRWRLTHHVKDNRILVVTIDESDIAQMSHWPISDALMAQLVGNLSTHGPDSIGLDVFRNIAVAPGTEELLKVFESTPNVFGVEQVVGETVPPNGTLASLGQTAAADLVVDTDGRVRRGLLSILTEEGKVYQGLAARLALNYLSSRNIYPEELDSQGVRLQLGETTIKRFEKNDGSYVREGNSGGYQVLMNYRHDYQRFETVSLSSVLAGDIAPSQVRGRVVLVGATATSLNDYFYTPVSGDTQVAGVYIHAHLLSQLLGAAIDGQSFLKTVSNGVEWLWTAGWVGLSVAASRSFFYSKSLKSRLSVEHLLARLLLIFAGLSSAGYGLLLIDWWLPIALPAASVGGAVVVGFVHRNQQLQSLAAFDELTQVANRRYFDQHLAEILLANKQVSLIMCDVDYFKAYNDLYGHPAGDRCLQHVAQAIRIAIRHTDLVARYGGEEFVVVLPQTSDEIAVSIAERIQEKIQQMSLPHSGSAVSGFVTLSCGVASVSSDIALSSLRLVEYADQALYKAKQSGRNQVVLSHWQNIYDADQSRPSLPEGEAV